MTKFNAACAALCLLPAAAPLLAQAPAPAPKPFAVKLTLDLGLVNAAGNTRVTTLNAGDQLELTASAFQLSEFTTVVYGRTGDSTTAEQIKAGVRLERRLVSVLHGFAGVTYERNRFAGIARRLEEFAGLGLRIVDLPNDRWTLDIGGVLNQKKSTASRGQNFAALQLATLYHHNFTKTAYLAQKVEVLPSVQATGGVLVNSESSVVAPVAGRIALKLSYVLRYDTQPPPGFGKSDRVLSSGLQIVF